LCGDEIFVGQEAMCFDEAEVVIGCNTGGQEKGGCACDPL
jgi:hypothetical protein